MWSNESNSDLDVGKDAFNHATFFVQRIFKYIAKLVGADFRLSILIKFRNVTINEIVCTDIAHVIKFTILYACGHKEFTY